MRYEADLFVEENAALPAKSARRVKNRSQNGHRRQCVGVNWARTLSIRRFVTVLVTPIQFNFDRLDLILRRRCLPVIDIGGYSLASLG